MVYLELERLLWFFRRSVEASDQPRIGTQSLHKDNIVNGVARREVFAVPRGKRHSVATRKLAALYLAKLVLGDRSQLAHPIAHDGDDVGLDAGYVDGGPHTRPHTQRKVQPYKNGFGEVRLILSVFRIECIDQQRLNL